MSERERKKMSVCVRQRERECVCVCQRERQRQRERERERDGQRESVCDSEKNITFVFCFFIVFSCPNVQLLLLPCGTTGADIITKRNIWRHRNTGGHSMHLWQQQQNKTLVSAKC